MPQKPSQASKAYSDSHAYIPPHVQEAMAKQVEHMSPSHMKQYAGAYVQQNMVQGRGAPQSGKVSGPPPGYRPVTHLPRKDHFHQYKVQQPSRAENFLPTDQTPGAQVQPDMGQRPPALLPQQPINSEQQYQQPAAQTYAQPEQVPGPQPNTMPDYDFFMNNQQVSQKKPLLPGSSSSLPVRIGLVVGGIVVLLIIFNVAKGLLAGPSNLPYYMSVIQDQEEIVHLSAAALEQSSLSTANKNFAATAQTSVKSSQTDIVTLVSGSNQKINSKQAALKISAQTDARLTSAASSGTFNPTFNEVMLTQLQTYKNDLNTVYSKTQNVQSKAIVKDQYKQAELLTQQLNSASTSAID
jgi:hypothetical protein